MSFDSLTEVQSWIEYALTQRTDNPTHQLRTTLAVFTEKAEVTNLLKIILNDTITLNAVAAKSYSHVNGFDKIVLLSSSSPEYKLRLHIWWPLSEEVARQKEGFRVHNHRWNFSSILLAGEFQNQYYEVSDSNDGIDMYEYQYFPPKDQDHYKMEFLGRSKLNCTRDNTTYAGDHYAISHTLLHRVSSNRNKTAATLFLQSATMKTSTNVFTNQIIEESEKIAVQRLSVSELASKLRDFQRCFDGTEL